MDHPLPTKPPNPDKKDAPTVLSKASCTTLGNLSHLLSLSTTQILSHAHQLLVLPPINTGTPKLNILPELNTLAKLSKSPDPKGQRFGSLASTQFKKAENCVHPIWTTLPEEHCILCCIQSEPLISLPVLKKHPPDLHSFSEIY